LTSTASLSSLTFSTSPGKSWVSAGSWAAAIIFEQFRTGAWLV
jgi:hypothetical protein